MDQNKEKMEIAKSAVHLSLLSIIAVLISFGKESVLAYYYGASAYTDAYNISIDTPKIIFTFISMAISTIIVPVYTKSLIEYNKDRASYFFQNFTTIVLISYIILLLLGELSAYFIIWALAPGLDKEIIHLAVILFQITIPAIGFGLFCKINAGILNSHKSFLLPSVAPIIFNLAVILSVIILAKKVGIYAATVGTVVGMILELLFTCCFRKRYVSYKLTLDFHDEITISALKMAGPVFVGMSAAEINLIVDKVVASFFGAGSISSLNYASKLSSGISTLFITSITTVIFPELAEHVANKNEEKAARTYIFSIRIFIVLLMPIIAGGVFLSREIMMLIYGRGAFDSDAIAMTTPVFACYFMCLLFTGLRQVGTNFLYSYGDSKTAMKNTVVGVGINIILDVILSRIMGVAGLALATTLSVAVISILLMRSAKHKNKYVCYCECLWLLLQTGFACGIMLVIIWLMKHLLISGEYYNRAIVKQTIFYTVAAVLLGICVYTIMLFLLKVKEIYYLIDLGKRGLSKKEGK